jgi:hypothetical protein
MVSIATKQNIDDALESICKVMNAVQNYFENGTVAYQFAFVSAEGNKLINRLRQAQLYCEHLREVELSLKSEA